MNKNYWFLTTEKHSIISDLFLAKHLGYIMPASSDDYVENELTIHNWWVSVITQVSNDNPFWNFLTL